MKKIFIALLFALSTLFSSSAQEHSADVFVPIAKYIQTGHYDNLSAWFAETLELDIMGKVSNCSRNQAKLIVKSFFSNYKPQSFSIIHKSGKSPMKFAVGKLSAGGSKFRIIIYVRSDDNGVSNIQQLKIIKE